MFEVKNKIGNVHYKVKTEQERDRLLAGDFVEVKTEPKEKAPKDKAAKEKAPKAADAQ